MQRHGIEKDKEVLKVLVDHKGKANIPTEILEA